MDKRPTDLQTLIEEGGNLFLPNISVDNVIFGYEEGYLKVLLLEIAEGKWMLPGGFIFRDEAIEEASRRVLQERTGLEPVYYKQFHTFGQPGRNYSHEIRLLFESNKIPWDEGLWINQRYVSVGYYSLVHLPQTTPLAGLFARDVAWFSLNAMPTLLMDHPQIIEKALQAFRKDLQVAPVACHLLSEKFTMPQLHRLYESVFDKKMDRSRFQKKMLEYDVFERLEEKPIGLPHRSPYLYTLKK